MRTIKCTIKESEYHVERLAELHYTDSRYEVYSYQDRDGIWGTYWDTEEDMIKDVSEKVLEKYFNEGCMDMEIELPFVFVTRQGYTILNKKTQKPVTERGEDDLYSVTFNNPKSYPSH